MTWLQLSSVLAFIFMGARLDSIGFAGAAGVAVLTLGLGPGTIP